MKNAEYVKKLKEIGWIDNIAINYYQDSLLQAQQELLANYANPNKFSGALMLTEESFDEEELYDIAPILRDFKFLSHGDLVDDDIKPFYHRNYVKAQELFDDVNAILAKKGIQKAFYILPRIDQMVFYVYKPIAIFEKAVELGLIDYTEQKLSEARYSAEVKAILFDLDGTLIDTAPDFIRIIKVMCQKHNHPCPTDEAIREQVSAGARAMVKLMFGDELANVADSDPKLLAYRQEFLDTYEADICVDSRLFVRLDELLVTLESQGIPWGIVTNKPRYLAEILLEKLNLTQRCAVLVCPDDVKNTKPDPEPMFLAVKILNETLGLNLTAENCVYVGDHIRDIQAGKSANMRTILAGYGYIPPEDQADLSAWGADVIVDDTHELYKTICDLISNEGHL